MIEIAIAATGLIGFGAGVMAAMMDAPCAGPAMKASVFSQVRL